MSGGPPQFATLLLDSDGVSKLAQKDALALEWLERALRFDARVVVPWVTLAEALQGANLPAVQYRLSQLSIEALTEDDFRSAAKLMRDTSMGGHTIDAILVAVASRLARPVVILTSDPDDLRKLAQEQSGIVVARV